MKLKWTLLKTDKSLINPQLDPTYLNPVETWSDLINPFESWSDLSMKLHRTFETRSALINPVEPDRTYELFWNFVGLKL